MRKFVLMALMLLATIPAFADDECRACEGAGYDASVGLYCNVASADQMGSLNCLVISRTTNHGVSAMCFEFEPYCMTIEVYG